MSCKIASYQTRTMEMEETATRRRRLLQHFMLIVFVSAGILPQGTLANFEPVNGPGYDSPGFESVRGPGLDAEEFVCNETWVAWENTTEPHYLLFEFFVSSINYTYYDLQVLSGSHPIFYVQYFEEDENGERGRPVICQNPPGQIVLNSTDELEVENRSASKTVKSLLVYVLVLSHVAFMQSLYPPFNLYKFLFTCPLSFFYCY